MRSRIRCLCAVGALLLCCVVSTTLGQSVTLGQSAETGGKGELALSGTIWVAKEPHNRVTVGTDGTIEIKEGKDIYVRFIDQVDDIFVIEIRWWNLSVGIHVVEYGLLTRVSPSLYRYIEADQLEFGIPNDDFPGIMGSGTFELQGRSRAKLIQFGHLIDGSASGFTTMLERADAVPEVPIDQTYP